MLNGGEFISSLSNFDVKSLQNKQIKKKLRECIPYTVEDVTLKSGVCGTFLKWVKCMEAIVSIRFPDRLKATVVDNGERQKMKMEAQEMENEVDQLLEDMQVRRQRD